MTATNPASMRGWQPVRDVFRARLRDSAKEPKVATSAARVQKMSPFGVAGAIRRFASVVANGTTSMQNGLSGLVLVVVPACLHASLSSATLPSFGRTHLCAFFPCCFGAETIGLGPRGPRCPWFLSSKRATMPQARVRRALFPVNICRMISRAHFYGGQRMTGKGGGGQLFLPH